MKKSTRLLGLLLAGSLLLTGGCQKQEEQVETTGDLVSPEGFYESFRQAQFGLDSTLFQDETADANGLLGMYFDGVMGERVENQVNRWMYTAYYSNPGMMEAFRQRDSGLSLPLQAWYGEFPGKYLTSLSLMYQLTHDQELQQVADDLIVQLASVQDEDGYLGVFSTTDRFLGAVNNDINGTANHGSNWDLWNHYHIIRGLLAWHRQTGSQQALDVACKAADSITTFFSEGHSLAEVGETDKNLSIASAYVTLYELTQEQRYLDFLNDCLSAWQLDTGGDFYRKGLSETPYYALPLNRWEGLHSVLALARVYELTGDESYKTAFLNLWESLRDYDRHNSGGVTNGERAIGTPYQEGCVETCATVAWLEISAQALRLTGEPAIADELELATWNAQLGAQSPSGRWYTYNTPDEGVRLASSHELTFQAVPGSPELNCCALSGPSGLGLLGEWGLFTDSTAVTLNYYGAGQLAATTPAGKPLLISQETNYPAEGGINLSLNLAAEEEFTVRLRIPAWSGATQVAVNGQEVPAQAGSYCELTRLWKAGDKITMTLDMTPHVWVGRENRSGQVSVYRGPLLLAVDERFNEALAADDLEEYPLAGVTLTAEANAVIPPYPQPIVLLRAQLENGQSLLLCDFATAGMAGTNYATWIPVAEAEMLTEAGQSTPWLSGMEKG